MNSKKEPTSSTILSNRLEIRTQISKNSNPVLYIIEEQVRELLLTKYKEEFKLTNLETKKINPDYHVDANVEYQEAETKEKGLFGFLRKKKSKSILENRLEIRIKANRDDNIFDRIKKDINDLIYSLTEKQAEKVVVERDTSQNGCSETISIIIRLQ